METAKKSGLHDIVVIDIPTEYGMVKVTFTIISVFAHASPDGSHGVRYGLITQNKVFVGEFVNNHWALSEPIDLYEIEINKK